MGGEKRDSGAYDGIAVLPFKQGAGSFFVKCIRHFLPVIYNPIHSKMMAGQIQNIFSKNGTCPDVIHYHDLAFAPVAVRLKKTLGCKLIFDSHEFFFSYAFNGGLNKKTCLSASRALLQWKNAIKSADFTIGCTKTMDNLISIIRQDDNHGIIYNSSMFAAKTQKRSIAGKEKIVLLHEGAMPFNRGLKLMLEMFRDEYIREHFKLRIVGTVKGAEKEYFDQKCRDYNITEENIYFTGWVDYLEVPNALQGDIGILFFEKSFNAFYSMPNKLFNYHNAGLPVLATHCADLSDTIRDLKTGVIIERNVEAVKDGLKELVAHYEVYQTNVLFHQQEFNWQSDEKQLFEIYEGVLR